MVAHADSEGIKQLGTSFWPGALTLVLRKKPGLSTLITGGRDTVAVRMPSHWIPFSLATQLGRPITGTSANRSGQSNLNSPEEIRKALGNLSVQVVDLGPAPAGLQSTIVDMTGDLPALLREGATSFEDVLRVWEQANSSAPQIACGRMED
jgi:L-threonylcarbamoyladenylate synthase